MVRSCLLVCWVIRACFDGVDCGVDYLELVAQGIKLLQGGLGIVCISAWDK